MKKVLLAAAVLFTTLALPASAAKPVKPVAVRLVLCGDHAITYNVRYSNGKVRTFTKPIKGDDVQFFIATDPLNHKQPLPQAFWVHYTTTSCTVDIIPN